ncbi:MAG: hypothetical protein ICV83_03315 [Cytophagales bacterium]|nr:hypothetical protein [Cytophagales bacterium]
MEKSLRELPQSELVRIIQIRQILKQNLLEGAGKKNAPFITYLELNASDTLIPLWPQEQWILFTSALEFTTASNRIKKFSMGLPASWPRDSKYRPPQDGLYEAALDYVRGRSDELAGAVAQSSLSTEDKQLMGIYLRLLLAGKDKEKTAKLDADIKTYLAAYPATPYESFLRRFIAPEYESSRFGYGLDFHSGTAWFSGKAGTVFNPGANLGHGFEFSWDRYMFYLRNYIGLGKTSQAFTYRGEWRQGLRINYYVPEVSVGYLLLDTKRIRIVPFAGISAFSVAPTTKEVNADPANDVQLSFKRPFTVGVNLDVKLAPTQHLGLGYQEAGFWMLKIRGGFRSARARFDANFTGSVIYLDLGIGGFGKKLKEKKR